MMKRIRTALFIIMVTVISVLPMTAHAREPEIMSNLKSHIQTYGTLKNQYFAMNGTEVYTTKIAWQKKKKRFLFQCTHTNGRSTSTVTMYMPASKKKAAYTVYFDQTIRAGGKTARISGKAKVNRKTYCDQSSRLRFSRKNKNSYAKHIKNNTYQNAANGFLRSAFQLWEKTLETRTTLCFRNFGFSRITVFDGRSAKYAKEW